MTAIASVQEKYMKEALKLARKAAALGEVPIGCVIVHEGKIIGRGYNRRNTDKSTLCHAEITAIRKAGKIIGDWRLEDCTLYVTLEPCQMCAGAIIQARIPEVVMGCMNPKAGCAGSILNLLEMPEFNHQAKVYRGVLEQECSELLKEFFTDLRKRNKAAKKNAAGKDSPMNIPERRGIPTIDGKIRATGPLTVEVPGSKSITNRALLLATLAQGTSTLRGVLFSDDSRHFLKCVQDLGFETTVDEDNRVITVTGLGGAVPRKEASLYVGSAGTAARFLTAYLGISGEGCYEMDASEQMRRRPMAPLLEGLRSLGCEISCSQQEGFFPFTVNPHGFGKTEATINIDNSSQFLSALLISSCLCPEDFQVHVTGTHGMAYIEMTRLMMEQFGVTCEVQKSASGTSSADAPASPVFRTPAGQHYKALDYPVEPDVSAACYFYAMCPLLNIPVQVSGVHFDSLQGDVEFIRIMEKLGCQAEDQENGILLTPPADGHFPGITVNMGSCSDQAITLAAIAPFADGPVTIEGIGHIRLQESDRLMAIVNELEKMKIHCEYTDTSVTIYPGAPQPALVETYEDHRMAMGFSLTGLRASGIVIDNPACCRKTFENYFEVLDSVISRLTK